MILLAPSGPTGDFAVEIRPHFLNRRKREVKCGSVLEFADSFIGGSDARIIMGSDEAALIRLWREKRGEAEPEDLSGNLIVQLGSATEELNRSWYERNTGRRFATSSAG